jgi:CubicO group peptidase (beta-lactamase class C family)
VITTLMLCASLAASGSPDVDAVVRPLLDSLHVPAIAVAVVKDGACVFAKGYGLANVEDGAPATADTVFRLLSVGKQFTAAAILALAHDGKLGLDDPIAKRLPDVPEAWAAVTIRQLLSHSSGIHSYHEVPGYFQQLRLDRTPRELLDPVRGLPLDFPPGSAARYSNSNYFLLGLAVESATGKSYGDVLAERFFRPLGMTSTRLDAAAAIVPHRAAGYTWRDGILTNAEAVSPTQTWAAGGVISSAADLARFEVALASGRVLPKEMLELSMAPARLADGSATDFGLGNEIGVDHGHRFAGHQGGGLAFDATVLRFPDDALSVIVLCNLTAAPSRTIARRLACLWLPALSDEANPGIADDDPKTTAQLRDVVLAIAKGALDEAAFGEKARRELVPLLRQQGPRLLGRLGSLEAFTLLERRTDGALRTHRCRATFEKGKLVFVFHTTGDGVIDSIDPPTEE